jgi:pimeloyl-ACP methyl ester carboxylesterase
MAWFVLVPGANHGGWWYEPLVADLEAAGHRATAVTLPGLDPDGPAAPDATLDSHIDHLASILRSDDPAVLVGHSYGGSVITGAADRSPESIAALQFLDAFVPQDGESAWDQVEPWEHDWYVEGSRRTGLGVDPLPFFDDRARPHPLGTLMQASKLTGAWKQVPHKRYVLAADEEWLKQSSFPKVADRYRDDAAWQVTDVDATHNLLRDGTGILLPLLLDLGATVDAT